MLLIPEVCHGTWPTIWMSFPSCPLSWICLFVVNSGKTYIADLPHSHSLAEMKVLMFQSISGFVNWSAKVRLIRPLLLPKWEILAPFGWWNLFSSFHLCATNLCISISIFTGSSHWWGSLFYILPGRERMGIRCWREKTLQQTKDTSTMHDISPSYRMTEEKKTVD